MTAARRGPSEEANPQERAPSQTIKGGINALLAERRGAVELLPTTHAEPRTRHSDA